MHISLFHIQLPDFSVFEPFQLSEIIIKIVFVRNVPKAHASHFFKRITKHPAILVIHFYQVSCYGIDMSDTDSGLVKNGLEFYFVIKDLIFLVMNQKLQFGRFF
ncbi:hypothetical protein D3C72_424990 [compost metagenome]